MDELRAIFNAIALAGGAVFPAASSNEIDLASNALIAQRQSSIPPELTALLSAADGFYHNGFELYGAMEHRHEKELFSLPSILQFNDEVMIKNHRPEFLGVAAFHDEILFYHQNELYIGARHTLAPFAAMPSLLHAMRTLMGL